MKKVLLRGPLLSNSGYGVHSRQVFEYLITRKDIDLKCDILSWGNTSWQLKEYDDKSFLNIEKIIEKYISKDDINSSYEDKFDETYQVCFPNEWIKISSFDVGITAGVETTLCNPMWLKHINLMDKVIVPSEFTMQTFENTSKYHDIEINTDIKVIPEYYPEEFLLEQSSFDILKNITTENNVLIIGQLTSTDQECDRKNIFETIEHSIRELSKYENTGLIIKTNLGSNNFKDFINVRKAFSSYIKEIKEELKEKTPKLYFIHGNMSPLELKSLYESKKIKFLLSCTRGEGFGLTMLEAAVCGLPIVATNHSAYKEYLDYFIGIDCKINNISHKKIDNEVFVENSSWADFDKNSLSDIISKIFNNNLINYEKVSLQKKNLINKMSKTSIINIYKNYLSE